VLGEDVHEDEVFEVWPENWQASQIFLRCGRAWDIVIGPGGAFYQGVRPESVESVMRVSHIPPREREALLDDVLVMAAAAAEVLNRKG